MSYQVCLDRAVAELQSALDLVRDEVRNYPTPIAGCDAQYNHLIGLCGSISDALQLLSAPKFVPTPRTPTPDAGVESR